MDGAAATTNCNSYVRLTITCSRRARGRAASDSGSRYAEIGYFGHEVFVEQYVLGFEVTMNHTALVCVQKLHAFGNLWGWSVDNSYGERELI